jgi:hypothetical protein
MTPEQVDKGNLDHLMFDLNRAMCFISVNRRMFAYRDGLFNQSRNLNEVIMSCIDYFCSYTIEKILRRLVDWKPSDDVEEIINLGINSTVDSLIKSTKVARDIDKKLLTDAMLRIRTTFFYMLKFVDPCVGCKSSDCPYYEIMANERQYYDAQLLLME